MNDFDSLSSKTKNKQEIDFGKNKLPVEYKEHSNTIEESKKDSFQEVL